MGLNFPFSVNRLGGLICGPSLLGYFHGRFSVVEALHCFESKWVDCTPDLEEIGPKAKDRTNTAGYRPPKRDRAMISSADSNLLVIYLRLT